jgi:two-component system, chemotaxis family, protein-glutamate methylesterase/glutaminase
MRSTGRHPAERRSVNGGNADYDVVVIGASAGGLACLIAVLRPLPADFGSAVMIVQHLSPEHKSAVAQVIQRYAALSVHQAINAEVVEPGVVYVAPPNFHLVVHPGKLELTSTAMVHYTRPAIDILFESAAASYGSRCIAVVLSGTGNDGARGTVAVKEAGGLTIAQDPHEAEFNSMPLAAIATGKVDHVLPMGDITDLLAERCRVREKEAHG